MAQKHPPEPPTASAGGGAPPSGPGSPQDLPAGPAGHAPAAGDQAAAPGETRGPAHPAALEAEADVLCDSLEKLCRSRSGEMPSAADMAEVRAHQAAWRDLVSRALQSGAGAAGELAEQRRQIETLKAEAARLKAEVARSRSDFLNYQQRASNDLRRAEELALRNYVSDMLPILDGLEPALADAQGEQAGLKHVREALRILAEGLNQALKVRGLERVSSAGKAFDPMFHEAVSARPADPAKGEKPNQVIEELRPGYLWKGLLLRPAQVLVTVPAVEAKKEQAG